MSYAPLEKGTGEHTLHLIMTRTGKTVKATGFTHRRRVRDRIGGH